MELEFVGVELAYSTTGEFYVTTTKNVHCRTEGRSRPGRSGIFIGATENVVVTDVLAYWIHFLSDGALPKR